jgi:hypothetical protein
VLAFYTTKFGQRIKSEEAACLAGHRIELADHFLDYRVFLLSKLTGFAFVTLLFTTETEEAHEIHSSEEF